MLWSLNRDETKPTYYRVLFFAIIPSTSVRKPHHCWLGQFGILHVGLRIGRVSRHLLKGDSENTSRKDCTVLKLLFFIIIFK